MDCQMNFHNPLQQEAAGVGLERRGSMCVCSTWVIAFFAILLGTSLGLIFGTLFAADLLIAIPALIIFAAVMAVLIVALLIYRYCMCCRGRRC